MRKDLKFETAKKVFPIILLVISIGIAAAQLVTRLNLVAVVSMAFCAILSAVIFLSLVIKKKVYAPMVYGYAIVTAALFVFHVVWGADAGFGAFTSGKTGWTSVDNPLMAGEGTVLTRILGNLLLSLPVIISLLGLVIVAKKSYKSEGLKKFLSGVMSVLLMGSSVFTILFGNMRTKPVTDRLWDGQDDYLNNVDKNTDGKPNVLVVMMDDLGYGDISLNGSIYETPNIDSIGENGLNFENFYSAYSVCSPARFACMTGRYPYRGYADNVIYPTVDTLSPFAQTRIFNSIEMGNNADGMLGDEITIAETFKAAGYSTGAFGKWHLGDYGEYLPTNQGFDYFYGSHHVNDMAPFYHVKEENGEYEIVHGTEEMKKDGKKDQSELTKWIHDEISAWIADKAEKDEPFFAYYATPWPHGPVFAGDDFDGVTGMGTYVDCVTEFDTYLGKLFAEMEELGVLEDTIIVFTSDNGPALEGSVGGLRGGKYLAYEGGQKVPFMIRWDNNDGLFEKGEVREQSASLVDLYPTLVELCGITGKGGTENYLPTDREIDGVSMVPVITKDKVIHTKDHPILHMKRENVKAIQYTVPTKEVTAREEYSSYDYDFLKENKYLTFKYFKRIQNDNSAFFDKYRKNWLHILTDDFAENYNRTPVFPEISDEMKAQLDGIQKDFAENRRGIIK